MSCDWGIYCMDCRKFTGTSDNENHAEKDMQLLIKHASAIAALKDLKNESNWDFSLQSRGHHVDVDFFAGHAGHQLRTMDEYGRFSNQCDIEYLCPRCRKTVRCEERDHSHSDVITSHEHNCPDRYLKTPW